MSEINVTETAEFRRACDDGGSCVEVALLELIGVRDSKDPDGPVLLFTRTEWIQFVTGVKAGLFDF
jgi:hypothetical protein